MEGNELVHVTQFLIIEEQFHLLKERWEQKARDAEALVCTEESAAAIKSYRADMRKEFAEVERQYKEARAAAIEPITRLDSVFKECITEPFRRADASFKGKVSEVEAEIKGRCESELREYFDELCEAHHLEWLDFERACVKVDMASAKQKTPKRLREQLAQFVATVSKDVDTISTMEDADEILVEYKMVAPSLGTAMLIVSERNKRIEEEAKFRAERERIRAAEQENERKVEALAPPTVVAEPETLTVTFTVTDTRERLIALREWMKANHYEYK